MKPTSTNWRALPVPQGTLNLDVDTIMRQSTIGQLFLCGGRVKHAQDEGFLEPVNEKMVFGTCTHFLAEQDLLAGEERLDLLTNMGEWVDNILVSDYDWSLNQVTDPIRFFSELGVAYRTWRTQVRPHLTNPIGIEKEMFLPLGQGRQGNVWLKGTPDVVLEDTIVDFKTSGRAWKQGKADLSIQASLYMPLVKQNLDHSIRKFVFWVYDRSNSQWDKIKTSRTIREIDSALNTAYSYGIQHEAEIYSYTPVPEASFVKKRGWYCSPNYCGAWNVCPGKFLHDDKSENAVAIRSWS